MKGEVKRVAAIHDLSGFGRVSLTAIIPILSTMGAQVCPIPTAILSTHTGGFKDYSFVDLTDSMVDFIRHWKDLNLEFDCIYSGFLGSVRQIEIVSDFIDYFGNKNNLTVVDPVMGDNGKLYSTMTEEMISKMRNLISKADIITPNFTEAAFLLDKQYCEYIDDDDIKKWLVELSRMGPDTIVITSVRDDKSNENMSVIAYDKSTSDFWKVSSKSIPAFYPGTGDAFTSVLIGSLLQGDSLPVAIDRSVQFIVQSIKSSCEYDYPKREGILIEKELSKLNMPVIMSSFEKII
jgi:pyridoxine kinase